MKLQDVAAPTQAQPPDDTFIDVVESELQYFYGYDKEPLDYDHCYYYARCAKPLFHNWFPPLHVHYVAIMLNQPGKT